MHTVLINVSQYNLDVKNLDSTYHCNVTLLHCIVVTN